MSDDSRYEAKCPQHGWYFFEDGCAVAGCENAPAVDQSGAFPETLREAAQEVVAASETMAISGAHDRAIRFFNALFALRAALERPRPAPPEDCSPEYVGAIIDATKETIAECVCAQDHPLLSGRFVGALLKRGLRIYPLRSAGTGAAPPDLRDRVRDDWTAGYKAGQESGVPPSPEGANERFERIAAEFYEDTGYLRPGKDVPAAVGGESYDRERNAAWKIWNAARVRGGAAQPPPSASDDLAGALETIRQLEENARHDHRTLDRILAVMRSRTLPDDVALSEIQDYLTIAGYDVPLRSYDTRSGVPREETK